MMRPLLPCVGSLIRSDVPILFDKGNKTVTDDKRLEVNRRICEECENKKEYYVCHGKKIQNLPN